MRVVRYSSRATGRGVSPTGTFHQPTHPEFDPETAYDNSAYTITSTYHGGSGTLTMHTTHPYPSKDSKISTEYRITQLNSFAVTGNPDHF